MPGLSAFSYGSVDWCDGAQGVARGFHGRLKVGEVLKAGEVCFSIGCRCEDYRTKAIVPVTNMPLGAHNSTTPTHASPQITCSS